MLIGDPAYKFIHVEDFGYVTSYAPRTSFGDFQTMLSVSTLRLCILETESLRQVYRLVYSYKLICSSLLAILVLLLESQYRRVCIMAKKLKCDK